MTKKLDCFVAKLFAPRNDMGKKVAFTLAEVLITLGIIGVVAALTFPTLLSRHNANVTLNKLKKFYTVMSQANNMAIAEFGPMDYWDGFSSSYNMEEMKAWFDKYIKPYVQVTDERITGEFNTGTDSSERFYVFFNDGSVAQFRNYTAKTPNIDENGVDQNHSSLGWNGYIHVYYYTSKKALLDSKQCINTFAFLFHDNVNQRYGFSPYFNSSLFLHGANPDRAALINDVKNRAGKQQCAGLIMYDGWQIKDDYPFKF